MLVRLMCVACLLVGCAAPTPRPPTAVAIPTTSPQPTATPTPRPLAVPQGFAPADPATYGLTVESLAQPGLEVQELLVYEGPQDAVIFAFWGQVTRQAAAADTLLNEPEALAQAFLRGYDTTATPKPFTPDVGERAAGFNLPPITVIAFERDGMVAVLTAINFDGLLTVARTLDERLSIP